MSEIRIENINKKIKDAVILNDVTLTFSSGKIYGLKGKNGSGKTMLMRTIAGLLIPDSGTVTINGKTLHKDISFPESIGILIENPAFLPQYTGYKNLKLLASLSDGISDGDIKTALERVGLLIMSLESVFGALTGALVLHEFLSGRELIGSAILFAGVIVSQLTLKPRDRR